MKLILIPLKKFCSSTTQVAELIERLFTHIKEGKDLTEFRIGKRIAKGGKALADSLILEPNSRNQGITMEDVINYLGNIDASNKYNYTIPINKTVNPIHFEDYSGIQFERLVFAFVSRQRRWDKIHWLGQTGSDGGRDIWGMVDGKTFCYQCANYQKLTFKKIADDIDKLIKGNNIPNNYIVVAGGTISGDVRKKITEHSHKLGVLDVEIWSGVEFEEKLRHCTPELIRRFVNGESFPETPSALKQLVNEFDIDTDQTILQSITECFDRPAFTTRFNNESNIPDFEKAITDTIEVLNTGVRRLRDGFFVKRIPSRHEVKDPQIKDGLQNITQLVIQLRNTFNELRRNNQIKPCGCGKNNCSIWILTDKACIEMDIARKEIFSNFKGIFPSFNLQLH
ncbi:hypothetical protein [Chitinophaga sp. CB10]|uniref:hypothetical protein n=1 Tax=Chitinophaga sp. CB10 TaxID=1891659 RepID=UPI0025C09A8A|nr:hypothetical protein [Chitinophaga sp. CB10]